MPKIKGITFLDARDFVLSQGGPAAWDRMKSKLSEEEYVLFDTVVGSGWYDLDVNLRVLEAMPEVLGGDLTSTMREYAKFCTERHVNRVYRVLFLFANPAIVLEKSGEYWSRFYDTGELRVRREGSHRARADLVGFPRPTAAHCEFIERYSAALFERVGAKHVKSSHPKCRLRGDSVCSMVIDWR